MKLVYLASPYTYLHDNLDLREQIEYSREVQINRIAADLEVRFPNIVFFLPITQSAALRRENEKIGSEFKGDIKRRDLFVIRKKSDELWVVKIDGWKESVGVQEEIKHAKKHGIKVVYVNPKKPYKLTNSSRI